MSEPATLEQRCTGHLLDLLLAWGLVLAAIVVAAVRPGTAAAPWLVVGACGLVLAGGAGCLVATGATPGLALAGARVVDEVGGGRPGWVPALARAGILFVAGPPTLGVGAVLLARSVARDPSGHHRAWHDRRTGTRVLHADPGPTPAPTDPATPVAGRLAAGPVNLTALRLAGRDPRERPTAPTDHAPRATVRGPWVLHSGQRHHVLSEPVLVGTGPAACIELSGDGMPVVTALGSARGGETVRHGVRRPLRPGATSALLPGDVVRVTGEQVRVELADPVSE